MESLYQVSLVDDDIDGQRMSGWHLRQLALIMKILNGANMEGYGQADGLFAKMAVIIRVIEPKVAPPQIITMRHCEQRVISFSISWITSRGYSPIFRVRSLSLRWLISIHVFIRRQEEEKEKKSTRMRRRSEGLLLNVRLILMTSLSLLLSVLL